MYTCAVCAHTHMYILAITNHSQLGKHNMLYVRLYSAVTTLPFLFSALFFFCMNLYMCGTSMANKRVHII